MPWPLESGLSLGLVTRAYSLRLTRCIHLFLCWRSITLKQGKKSHGPKPNLIERVLVRVLWDAPLMFGIFTGNYLGLRLLDDGKGNFISVIDDDIVMSSMPLPSDLPELKRNKVMSVVNMQAEWSGPEAGYREAGIEQLVRWMLFARSLSWRRPAIFARARFYASMLRFIRNSTTLLPPNINRQRLPTLDMSCPSKEDLRRGVAFIRRRLQETKAQGGRVLIHCKGGRGRATTMAVAYYAAKGEDPRAAFGRIKAVRPVAEPRILSYPSLVEFLEEERAC